jgi:hypothetical protein
VVDECRGGPRAKGDLEQDFARAWISPFGPGAVHDPASLLIAWPEETELGSHYADPAIRLGYRCPWVVEALRRGHESGVSSGSERKHVVRLAARDARVGREVKRK